jgi:plasmid stabilization system protein ParE
LKNGTTERVRVEWARSATRQLQSIKKWLSSIEGANPRTTIARIEAAAILLEQYGDIGRPGHLEGTRELSVRQASYLIVYLDKGDHFQIIAVFHTAQDR